MAELSEAANIVEEVVEETARRLPWGWIGGACLAGFGVGAAVGVFGTRRWLETKYEKMSKQEIAVMREHFRKRLRARDAKPDLSGFKKRVDGPPDPSIPEGPNLQMRDRALEAQDTYRKALPLTDTSKDVMEGWDYDEELKNRPKGGIYVIHRDELGETGNEPVTYTYYENDDILTDLGDNVVDDQEALVGDCFTRFGHGSGDWDLIYIRNEALSMDMEVSKTTKSFAEEVHGLKHEDAPRRRRPKR